VQNFKTRARPILCAKLTEFVVVGTLQVGDEKLTFIQIRQQQQWPAEKQ